MVAGGGATVPKKLKNCVAWRSSWQLTVARMEVKLGGDVHRWEGKKTGWVVSATSPTSGDSGLRKQPAIEREGRAGAVTSSRAWRLTAARMALKIGGGDHQPEGSRPVGVVLTTPAGGGRSRRSKGRRREGEREQLGVREREEKKKKKKERKKKERKGKREKEKGKRKKEKREKKRNEVQSSLQKPKTDSPKTILKT
ncbi:hypothetical protein CIPAW_06G057500 [Carya illinoinensis]|uniref:Uncharacterized protein n=1 Tax=Carya illinoinensis TaxID=32201 RepID=A0A8T1Q894_CARIL|nr:hypothetical protein CIPAW_06G057500 [Carya illinoinensis]